MVKGRKRTGAPATYGVAAEFRDRGLRSDDSVFTPGRPIWTRANFQTLQTDFVENADESDRGFEAKLADQLRTTPDPARQLFAELFCFHLLISSVITPPKKQDLIETVLAMMDDPVEIPQSVLDVLGLGMVNPGTYFNTGRWAQLGYLVDLGLRWKDQPATWRDEVLDDPWKFKEFAQGSLQSGTKTQFRATLHLLFPETFEAIVSDTHVDKILARFTDLATAEDPDRRLQEIRAELASRYGQEFDFYDERLRPLWEQELHPWPELIAWATKLYQAPDFDDRERNYKLDAGQALKPVIDKLSANERWCELLLDEAGSSKHNLVRWQTVDDLRAWLDTQGAEATLTNALKALWFGDEAVSARVQEFCDAIQPAVSTPGERTSLASYLLMGLDASTYPAYKPSPFTKVFELLGRGRSSGSEGDRYRRALAFCEELRLEAAERGLELRDNLDAQGLVWVLTGAEPDAPFLAPWPEEERQAFFAWRDGITPTDTDAEEEPARDKGPAVTSGSEALLQQAATNCHVPVSYLRNLEDLLRDKGQIVLYGPPGTGKTYIAQELAYALVGGRRENITLVQFHPSTTYEDFFEGIRPSTDDDGMLRYDVVPGPLARLATDARDRPDERFVMVIDELNRANLAKVLGELLFLLEYRNRAATTLYRPATPFQLPENLWFIATMNTVDRSVALIDAAMRRRFHFVPMYPDAAPISEVLASVCTDEESWVPELVDRVNELLVHDLGGRDHQIGPSHFITAPRTLEGIARVWRHSIEPLIEDQLFGQDERVRRYRWDNVLHEHSDLIPGVATAPGGATDEEPAGE